VSVAGVVSGDSAVLGEAVSVGVLAVCGVSLCAWLVCAEVAELCVWCGMWGSPSRPALVGSVPRALIISFVVVGPVWPL